MFEKNSIFSESILKEKIIEEKNFNNQKSFNEYQHRFN